MSIDDKRAEEDESDESPTSVIESEGADAENIDVERFTLPKSISVRSNGYVKVAQPGTSTAAGTRAATRPRTANTFNASVSHFRFTLPLNFLLFNSQKRSFLICSLIAMRFLFYFVCLCGSLLRNVAIDF